MAFLIHLKANIEIPKLLAHICVVCVRGKDAMLTNNTQLRKNHSFCIDNNIPFFQ